MERPEKTPKVSVCVITYNQEKYIRQCLQSIVNQQADFDFEIIVGDDCSSDGTREIIKEFAEKFPRLMSTIFQNTNTGGTQNYLDVHQAARGEYVAQIDGDDYALPGKLQAQADILDANPDVSFAVHTMEVIDGSWIERSTKNRPKFGSINDLLKLGPYFGSSSVMYRRKNEFERKKDKNIVDFYFHIERATRGAIYFDERVFGNYRLHSQGISKDHLKRAIIEDCYEAAYDRAITLGVDERLVQSSRMRRRMAFAIARYLSGDVDGYKKLISTPFAMFKYLSIIHFILDVTKSRPWFIGLLLRIQRILRSHFLNN